MAEQHYFSTDGIREKRCKDCGRKMSDLEWARIGAAGGEIPARRGMRCLVRWFCGCKRRTAIHFRAPHPAQPGGPVMQRFLDIFVALLLVTWWGVVPVVDLLGMVDSKAAAGGAVGTLVAFILWIFFRGELDG